MSADALSDHSGPAGCSTPCVGRRQLLDALETKLCICRSVLPYYLVPYFAIYQLPRLLHDNASNTPCRLLRYRHCAGCRCSRQECSGAGAPPRPLCSCPGASTSRLGKASRIRRIYRPDVSCVVGVSAVPELVRVMPPIDAFGGVLRPLPHRLGHSSTGSMVLTPLQTR